MTFRNFLKNNFVILDGGLGTLLQEKGLPLGEHPETWNITHPEIVIDIHKEYYNAGSNVINANTFGANPLKFSNDDLEKIIKAALENAKKAQELSIGNQEKYISLDVGSLGKLLKPFGDLDFEKAVDLFAKITELGVKYGADIISIETMNDSYETKAAVLAAKENSDLPIIATNAYGSDGKLMTGASPKAMVMLLEGLGVDVLGANCSLGPIELMKISDELLAVSSTPIAIKPNAGLPKVVEGKTIFDFKAEEFSHIMAEMCKKGVRVIGGCCGTTPEFIAKIAENVKNISPIPVEDKNITGVSSYSDAVFFGGSPILIGERINPTGKKRFKQALAEHDIDYILGEGISQQEKGVHMLDVNVGLPEIDETSMLKEVVSELQAITNLPLQIDTSNVVAMEQAMRIYNGKPMINSVNGKKDSMDSVFPLVKKYGGLVVALTLDENGIPNTAKGRIEIAEKIIAEAEKYGISKKNLIFDTLAMTISADSEAAKVTLDSLEYIRHQLGCNISLGISNVSFGLPLRDCINSTFFSLALSRGLSAAIMNPYSLEMMRVYHSSMALLGYDKSCAEYIDFSSNPNNAIQATGAITAPLSENNAAVKDNLTNLQKAIVQGRKETAAIITKGLIATENPMQIVEKEIIPALDIVGTGFENKTFFLPQLLMSAEAAKASFEIIKENVEKSNETEANNHLAVIATVKGDIHDIGKNIVKLLMENYGFNVIDLGKDVSPKTIADCVEKNNVPLCCLSALMTTTVPSMEETIKLLRKQAPKCKVMVGGAVLNKEYASMIGADIYAKDAMEAVRKALEIF